MDARDTLRLESWLLGRASLAEVEDTDPIGLVGNIRFSEKARRAYRLIWAWSTHRFGGPAGAWQERVYARHGRAFVERRIARMQQWVNRFLGRAHFAPRCPHLLDPDNDPRIGGYNVEFQGARPARAGEDY